MSIVYSPFYSTIAYKSVFLKLINNSNANQYI